MFPKCVTVRLRDYRRCSQLPNYIIKWIIKWLVVHVEWLLVTSPKKGKTPSLCDSTLEDYKVQHRKHSFAAIGLLSSSCIASCLRQGAVDLFMILVVLASVLLVQFVTSIILLCKACGKSRSYMVMLHHSKESLMQGWYQKYTTVLITLYILKINTCARS